MSLLLSYEGVDVNLPTNLTGLHFQVTTGSLRIQCRHFTGDIVLSKRDVSVHPTMASSPSTKRTMDSSDTDDDDKEEKHDAKRLRPSFLNEVEQTLLLAHLNGSPSTSSHERESKGQLVKSLQRDEATEVQKEESSVDAGKASESTRGDSAKAERKAPTKKSNEKAKSAKKREDSVFSPDLKQSKSRKVTPDSSKKPSQLLNARAEPLSGKYAMERGTSDSPRQKPEAAMKWEIMESTGKAPHERWGHSTTKISNERVVVYGGTDDDERTLGDLHVFDMKTQHWTTPLNCETITRTWHDAVFMSSKNLVLVLGGERNSAAEGEIEILSDIMVLDTECFLWYPPVIRGSAPSARSGHTCTAIGNEVVVFGGSGGRHRQSSVHILDSDDWNWKTVKVEGKAPSARTYHSGVAVGDDKIVYFGGNDSFTSFNEVHMLQKMEKSANDVVWRWIHPCTVGLSPQKRTGHSATLLDGGKILIFGGWDPLRNDASPPTSVFSDSFLLDTKSWQWQPATFIDDGTVETAPRGRVGHGAVMHSNGRVYIFGGQDGAERRLKDTCAIEILQS